MRNLLLLPLLLALPASAAPPDWAAAPAVTVELSSFKFQPRVIRLAAGKPTQLLLENRSGRRHDFTAPEFFAAAALHSGSVNSVQRGKVDVPARGAVRLALVPAAGSYPLRCTRTLHSALGMHGRIVVA